MQALGTNGNSDGTNVNAPRPDDTWTRRLGEIAGMGVLIGLLWTMDTITKNRILDGSGTDFDQAKLIVNQATSALTVWLLVPAVAWWMNVFPLRRDKVLAAIFGHLIGTGLFATAHYFGMVLMRWAVHTVLGWPFVFSDFWLYNLRFEYEKDIKIYLGIVAVVAAYRLYRRSEADSVQARPDRLIVQTGSGETVIRQDDIEYLEAARNYVVVGTGEKEYLVRETLGNLERTLAVEQIVRTHRSYLVNIDRIAEIRTTDSGGHRIHMKSGKHVPLSRGYKEQFKNTING